MFRGYILMKTNLRLNLVKISTFCSKSEPNGSVDDTDVVTQIRNKVKLDVEEARKCVLIPWVFRRNISKAVNWLQDSIGVSAQHWVHFEDNTGLGKKPVLLVKMTEKVPWQQRFYKMKFDEKKEPLPDHKGFGYDLVRYKKLSPEVLNNCVDEKILRENLWEKKKLLVILDQVNELYEGARLSKHVELCQNVVISVLLDCLQSNNPGMFQGDLVPFGSGPCGLALQGSSDMDLVYLEDGKYIDRTETQLFLKKARKRLQQIDTVSNVTSILRAAVPIIRFTENTTSFNIDLCVSNSNGVKFCKLFQILDYLDNRIHPLIVTVRFWSSMNGLKSVYLSNFVLSMLVVHFLQYQQIAPPFKRLINDNPLEELPSSNKRMLDTLLVEFFKYYSTFDFNQNVINLYEGTSNVRSAKGVWFNELLMMENPFETHLNIGKSVTPLKLKDFQNLCKKSLKMIEEYKEKTNNNEEWGLNRILPCR